MRYYLSLSIVTDEVIDRDAGVLIDDQCVPMESWESLLDFVKQLDNLVSTDYFEYIHRKLLEVGPKLRDPDRRKE